MRDDPMRQADIQRRLANLAKAPRCAPRPALVIHASRPP
jgi:hypothetical protein